LRAITAIMMGLVLAGSSVAAAKESPEMNHEQMQKMYEEAAKPGAPHAMIAKGAGQWNCTIKAWMDPSAEPMTSKGTEQSEMIFGGRYLRSHFQGTMMDRPYEGMGTLGYDNAKKKYVGTWFDSMGTGIMAFEGDYNEQSKEMVCHGSYVDPLSGKETHTKLVTRFVSDDEHLFEMWGPDPTGRDVKWMEITYKRAK